MSNNEEKSREGDPIESGVPSFVPTSWSRGAGGRPVSEASGSDAQRDGDEHEASLSDRVEQPVVKESKVTVSSLFGKVAGLICAVSVLVGLTAAGVWFATYMIKGMLRAIGVM